MLDAEDVHYKISGKGKNVIFLHGFLENAGMWDTLRLEQLNITCWFIDLPGHGNSLLDLPINEDFSLDHVAEKVMNFIAFCGIDAYDIVGHSLGGYIALLLKSLDKKCGKTLLMNSNFWQDDENRKQNRDRFAQLIFRNKKRMLNEVFPNLFFNPHLHQKHIEKMRREAEKMEPKHIAGYSIAMKNRRHFGELLARFPFQIALIHGKKDPLISYDLLTTQLTHLHNPVFYLENAGHMPHVEDPQELTRIFKMFF